MSLFLFIIHLFVDKCQNNKMAWGKNMKNNWKMNSLNDKVQSLRPSPIRLMINWDLQAWGLNLQHKASLEVVEEIRVKGPR